MPIVFACAASHAPGMTAWTEAAPKEQADNFLGNYRKLGARLAGAKPDVIVALTVEHWANFFLNAHAGLLHRPRRALRRSDRRMAENSKSTSARRCKIANEMIDACLHGGFDPTFSDELLFDHATFLPLHFLNPNMAIPVVPVIINTLTPPMPTAKRCFAFGQFLGRALEKIPKRIALIATGGLSHWPGEAKHGKINVPFDKIFLAKSNQRQSRAFECVYPRGNQYRGRLRRSRNQNLDRARRRGGELESRIACLRADCAVGDRLRLSHIQPANPLTATR